MKIQTDQTQYQQPTVPPKVRQEQSTSGTATIADNRPSTVYQRKLRETMDASAAGKANPIQRKANNTGLPDNLKTGIENLSGYAMDDVKVHYNSSKPAQLQAHAYAQGTDIHLAPGQEKHLPHEAWHVVQQKQGRVKPTRQLKSKVNINDDTGLEKEADVMGERALQKAGTGIAPQIIRSGGVQESVTDAVTQMRGNAPYQAIRMIHGTTKSLYQAAGDNFFWMQPHKGKYKDSVKKEREILTAIATSGYGHWPYRMEPAPPPSSLTLNGADVPVDPTGMWVEDLNIKKDFKPIMFTGPWKKNDRKKLAREISGYTDGRQLQALANDLPNFAQHLGELTVAITENVSVRVFDVGPPMGAKNIGIDSGTVPLLQEALREIAAEVERIEPTVTIKE